MPFPCSTHPQHLRSPFVNGTRLRFQILFSRRLVPRVFDYPVAASISDNEHAMVELGSAGGSGEDPALVVLERRLVRLDRHRHRHLRHRRLDPRPHPRFRQRTEAQGFQAQRSVEGLGVDRAAHLELLLIVLSDVLVARDRRAVAALLSDATLPVPAPPPKKALCQSPVG